MACSDVNFDCSTKDINECNVSLGLCKDVSTGVWLVAVMQKQQYHSGMMQAMPFHQMHVHKYTIYIHAYANAPKTHLEINKHRTYQ